MQPAVEVCRRTSGEPDTSRLTNSGGRTRTGDLVGMSHPSCQLLYPAITPQDRRPAACGRPASAKKCASQEASRCDVALLCAFVCGSEGDCHGL